MTHARFVRAMARELVGSSHDADDVAQDTWRAAMEHAPPQAGQLRSWLGTLVRNFARRRWRDNARREHRERAAARDEAVPGPDAILEDREELRRVIDGVLTLAEPYRSTVLLRFYEGLPPRTIAERMQVPVDTVQTRLRRALTILRRRLVRANRPQGHAVWISLARAA